MAQCKCEKCGSEFKNRRKRKQCFNCRPAYAQRTFEYCYEIAHKYDCLDDFRDNEPVIYKYCRKKRWMRRIGLPISNISYDKCKIAASKCRNCRQFKSDFYQEYCKSVRKKWYKEITQHFVPLIHNEYTKEECILFCQPLGSRQELAAINASMEVAIYKNGWSDDCFSHMPKNRRPWTLKECWKVALLCSSRLQFSNKYNKQYNHARLHGWLDQICGHMEDLTHVGFSKSGFVDLCNRKSELGLGDGLATLYMIVCWGNGELFYKIGITSNTVKRRYGCGLAMPYNYEIMWEIRQDPAEIWDMEKQSHRETKEMRYQPNLWNGNARETFIL